MEIYYIVCQEYLECCCLGRDKDVCKIVAVADVNFINEAWFVNQPPSIINNINVISKLVPT